MHCEWFLNSHCHSCELLDKPYNETLKIKEKALITAIPEVSQCLKTTVGIKDATASRSKAKLAVFRENDQILFGFYNEKGIPKILEECPLHRSDLNNLLPALKPLLEKYKIEPYDLKTKRGELKYLILSQSHSHGELLIRFTLRSKESVDRLKKMAAEWMTENNFIKTVTANIQPHHQAIFEGDEEIILTEEHSIRHQFDDVTVCLGPRSFFQVTPEMAHQLYASAGNLVRDHSISSLLDLYCGVGAFSFFAAQSVPHVTGVEISAEAIRHAEYAVKFNKAAGTINFVAGDAEDFLLKNKNGFAAILVNPPRRGLNQIIIRAMIEMNPAYILYSSCNYQTLARDHEMLGAHYQIESAQIFDMFPFTEHFETLIFYSRK